VSESQENNNQVNAEKVVTSLSRQIGEQAQRIAMLEAMIDDIRQENDKRND
jgi:hypothetical protein